MVPFADNCNHSDVTIVQEIVNKKMHLKASRHSKYFTKTKFMNDYSACFDESDYAGDERKTRKVKGFFSKDNYEANSQFSSVSNMKKAIDQGI